MIYSFLNTLVKGYLKFRRFRIQAMYDDPYELQVEVFQNLLNNLHRTEYGKNYGSTEIKNYNQFAKRIPLVQYEDIYPNIERMMSGAPDILWPGKVKWYAKSSGTTNDKSKFIPISDDNLFENHVASSWDAMSILYNNSPDARIFDGKNLLMGGSLNYINDQLVTGDVSAILLSRMPTIGKPFYTPDFETALLSDWETKIDKMASLCQNEDVVMFAGVPTWTMVLFKKMLDVSGKNNIHEIWPNAKTYFHGGVGFDPYVEQFQKYLPDDDMEYYEVYNASEGYFAVQDSLNEKGMLLLLDNAIYYEFIPAEYADDPNAETLSLRDVEVGKHYCIVISTSSGLWRYKPGDIVIFVSTLPYRIMVSGRTKHYINVFGEEVMVHNTDAALKETCNKTGATITDYTVAPVYMADNLKGGHQWLIEFEKTPKDIDAFEKTLDHNLRSQNSDYDAKRFKDIALLPLKINVAPRDTFHRWLKSKGKIGGQSKIPRLSNNRDYLDELLNMIENRN
ncbi:MAG: GH3 auxin-responsive promoter family protein [Saprospiraceae bacterium]|nr:GH3 auxin-responsive promoter family protein [Saprospiraceae bacterium]